jgi:hypothetical protein
MPHEYTRQRQGRDFPIHNHLRAAEMSSEGNYNQIDGIVGNNIPHDDSDKDKTLRELLDQYKQEAERQATPIDGHEPPRDMGGDTREH